MGECDDDDDDDFMKTRKEIYILKPKKLSRPNTFRLSKCANNLF